MLLVMFCTQQAAKVHRPEDAHVKVQYLHEIHKLNVMVKTLGWNKFADTCINNTLNFAAAAGCCDQLGMRVYTRTLFCQDLHWTICEAKKTPLVTIW